MKRELFCGSWVAIVTPFNDGKIDEIALSKLLDMHLEAGTDGLVICGTTGESVTLSLDERRKLMTLVSRRVAKKIPLMLGTGANNTSTTVEFTREAADLGADAVLVVTPYYNKPTQAGLIAHFKAVAASTPLPVFLYNVPGRTGVNLLPQTVLELAKVRNIKAVKDASGNLEQAMDIIRNAPPGFMLFSGEDALNFQLMATGAAGTISVTGNVVPLQMKQFNDACLENNWEKARKLHFDLLDLHRGMFIESNPIPVKTALSLMGLIHAEFRLPLVPAAPATIEKLLPILKRMDLIKA
ncbi:MAG: 4-hydroxy-tetrahydrodipicolinate synthase [Candidatus Riflebacteria bacterium]|nr:4-hydroxy-tetrahydrodipicolinate synthase [Candidatus Riflebacteria bacterium]